MTSCLENSATCRVILILITINLNSPPHTHKHTDWPKGKVTVDNSLLKFSCLILDYIELAEPTIKPVYPALHYKNFVSSLCISI